MICKSLNDLPAIARALIEKHPDKRLFAFYGEMGAGKTTFIQFICEALGVEETVSSPTFSLVNAYQGRDEMTLFHFDFYRIEKLEEVYDMGYEEYFFSGNYCFMEWPEKIEPLLPPEIVEVYITINADDDSREILF